MLLKMLRFRSYAFLLQTGLIVLGLYLTWRLSAAIQSRYLIQAQVVASFLLLPVWFLVWIYSYRIYRGKNERRLAFQFDQQHGLKERLIAYVELRGTDHPFLGALTDELDKNLPEISFFRAGNPWEGTYFPIVMVFLVALSVVTVPYWPVPPAVEAKRQQQLQIVQQAKILSQQAAILQKKYPQDRALQQLLKEFEKVARNLRNPSVDRREALKNLNALQEKWSKAHSNQSKFQQEQLAKELRSMGASDRKNPSVPKQITQAESELSTEFQQALEGQGKEAQEITEAIRSGRVKPKDLEKFKKALEKYKNEKIESERKLAELEKSLKNAREGIVSGNRKVVSDSRMTERDVQKSKGGVEDGPGTTNLDIGPHHFDTQKKGKDQYMEDRTKADYEKIYKGQREAAGSEPVFLNSQWGEKTRYTRVRTLGLDSASQETTTSSGVGTQKQNESALQKEKIPAAYRKMVQKYFQSIQ
jgi:hypothetical protein